MKLTSPSGFAAHLSLKGEAFLIIFKISQYIKIKIFIYIKNPQANNLWTNLAGAEGFEPSARGFGDRCSTN